MLKERRCHRQRRREGRARATALYIEQMAEIGRRPRVHSDSRVAAARSALGTPGGDNPKDEALVAPARTKAVEQKSRAHAKAPVTDMTISAPRYSKATFTGENEWYTPIGKATTASD